MHFVSLNAPGNDREGELGDKEEKAVDKSGGSRPHLHIPYIAYIAYCILHIVYFILHNAYCIHYISHILHIAYIAYCILHILHIFIFLNCFPTLSSQLFVTSHPYPYHVTCNPIIYPYHVSRHLSLSCISSLSLSCIMDHLSLSVTSHLSLSCNPIIYPYHVRPNLEAHLVPSWPNLPLKNQGQSHQISCN